MFDPPRINLIGPPRSGWSVFTIMPSGVIHRFGVWKTREECEANIKMFAAQQNSHGSGCDRAT